MKKSIFIILAIIASVIPASCCGDKCERTESKKEEGIVSVQDDEVSNESEFPSISDPQLFGGSGFGIAFVSYIKTQNFDIALSFTSSESIALHGESKILDKYKSLRVDYTLKQVSSSTDGKYTNLRYVTNEFATSKYKDFTVIVENDSCKVVLPENIDDFLK